MLSPRDVEWLTSPEGVAALAAPLPDDLLARAEAIRRLVPDPHFAALLSSQAELSGPLRIHTRDGLEQGTHPLIAAWRAQYLAQRGVTRIADLTAGLGFDAAAFVAAGMDVLAVERDPGTAAALAVNVPSALVQCASAEEVELQDVDALFIDPARREPDAPHDGRRATPERDPEKWSPPLSWALQHPNACIKVAPGIDRARIPDGWQAIWTSRDRRLAEAMLVGPTLNTERLARSAHLLGVGMVSSSERSSEPLTVAPVGSILIEPDDAVIRSGLVTDLGRTLDAWLLDEHVAWLSADDAPSTPFARRYRVLERLPNKPKALRAALINRGYGNVVVKTRAVHITPEQLRTQLRLPGGASATLIVTRAAGAQVTYLVEAE